MVQFPLLDGVNEYPNRTDRNIDADQRAIPAGSADPSPS
jgi:hypothetical protein